MNRVACQNIALLASAMLLCAMPPSARTEEPPPLAGTAYVTSWFGGSVTVVKTIPVFKAPEGIAVKR